MISPESVAVVDRFFLSLESLKDQRLIRGKATFCKLYGINRRNLYKIEMNRESLAFQLCWLSYLVTGFGISADWLLTGKGEMFKKAK